MAITLLVNHFGLVLWARPLLAVPCVALTANSLSRKPWGERVPAVLSPRSAALIAVLLLGIVSAASILEFSAGAPQNDPPATMLCAAQDVLHGADPYSTYEPQCFRRLNLNLPGATPIHRGVFARSNRLPSVKKQGAVLRQDESTGSHSGYPAFGYPPEATLLLVPVAYGGWTLVYVWVAAVCLLLMLVLWRRPVPGRLYLVLWQSLAMWWLLVAFGWNPEDISYLLLAVGFGLLDRPRVSSLAVAAAVCSNPLTWIAAPVYAAILLGERDRSQRVAWLVGGVAAGTVPWLLWDHHLVAELWRFISLPEFAMGASLGPLLPNTAASRELCGLLLTAGIVGCASLAVARPQLRWCMVPTVFVCFALSWRGLLYYYSPVFWLTPAALVGWYRLEHLRDSVPSPARPFKSRVALPVASD